MTCSNSHGKPAPPLTLADIGKRLFALSFDPYHCPELRWGAKDLSTCPQQTAADKAKLDWYAAEQHLRNQPNRQYEQQMNYSLADLQTGRDLQQKIGLAKPPDICVEKILGAGSCQ